LIDDLTTLPNLEEGWALFQAGGDRLMCVYSAIWLRFWAFFLKDWNVNAPGPEECLELARQNGDRYLLAWAYYLRANAQASPDEWQKDMEASVQLLEALDNHWEVAFWRGHLAGRMVDLGDYNRARTIFEEKLQANLELGDMFAIASAYEDLGRLARLEQDYPAMERCFQQAYAMRSEYGGDRSTMVSTLNQLGLAALFLGDTQRAARHFKAVRPLIIDNIVWVTREHLLLGWASLAAACGEPVIAARCLGRIAAQVDEPRKKFSAEDYQMYERCLVFCREHLSADALVAAWKEGTAADPDRLLAEIENRFIKEIH
jgi:tetratricopeptide (TPR) repeat protein